MPRYRSGDISPVGTELVLRLVMSYERLQCLALDQLARNFELQ